MLGKTKTAAAAAAASPSRSDFMCELQLLTHDGKRTQTRTCSTHKQAGRKAHL
jgi:hypothetical protein